MKRKILLGVVLAVVAALAPAFVVEWTTTRGLRWEIREALHAAIRPVRLANCALDRFGSPHDGGYVMCANLLGEVESAYSYGIANDDNWRFPRLSRGVRRRRGGADRRTSVRFTVPSSHSQWRCGQAPGDQDGHRKRRARRVVGDARDLLGRVDQLVVEFHRINEPKVLRVMDKLKATFYVAYVHGNNWSCRWGAPPLPAGANEILFVNKHLAVLDGAGSGTAPVSPLAASNYPELPECQPRWP